MEKDLVYHQLTRKIIGCLYEAFNKLGYGYQEKYYQRAFAIELDKFTLPYKREQKRTIIIDNKIIGRYFVDFLINAKVAVEIKVADDFYLTHTNQLLAYLKTFDIRVGLLAVMTPKGVKIKRLVNKA